MNIAALILCSFATLPSVHAESTPVDQGYRQMYNLEFDEAHRLFREWERLHPEDPIGPVSDAAAYLFAEFDRLRILQSEFFVDNESFFHPKKVAADPAVKVEFTKALDRGARLAAAVLSRAPDDENAMLASLLSVGLRADYLALIEKRNLAALSEVKKGRNLAERLLAKHPDCYDAYLAIGVENYLLSQKPVFLRWLLRVGGAQTDKQVGLARLRLTAAKGRYLKPYALLLLAVADLRDRNRAAAKNRLAWLCSEFPRNPLYKEELAKLE